MGQLASSAGFRLVALDVILEINVPPARSDRSQASRGLRECSETYAV